MDKEIVNCLRDVSAKIYPTIVGMVNKEVSWMEFKREMGDVISKHLDLNGYVIVKKQEHGEQE